MSPTICTGRFETLFLIEIFTEYLLKINLFYSFTHYLKGFSHFYLAFNPNGATLSAAPDGFDKKFELYAIYNTPLLQYNKIRV